eukprot:2821530-Rhodomonas_salina.1
MQSLYTLYQECSDLHLISHLLLPLRLLPLQSCLLRHHSIIPCLSTAHRIAISHLSTAHRIASYAISVQLVA